MRAFLVLSCFLIAQLSLASIVSVDRPHFAQNGWRHVPKANADNNRRFSHAATLAHSGMNSLADLSYDIELHEDVIALDHEFTVHNVECSSDSMTLHVNNNSELLARVHEGSLLNGGEQWGCVDHMGATSAFVRRVMSVEHADEKSITVTTTHAPFTDMFVNAEFQILNKQTSSKETLHSYLSQTSPSSFEEIVSSAELLSKLGESDKKVNAFRQEKVEEYVSTKKHTESTSALHLYGWADNDEFQPGDKIPLSWQAVNVDANSKLYINLRTDRPGIFAIDQVIESWVVPLSQQSLEIPVNQTWYSAADRFYLEVFFSCDSILDAGHCLQKSNRFYVSKIFFVQSPGDFDKVHQPGDSLQYSIHMDFSDWTLTSIKLMRWTFGFDQEIKTIAVPGTFQHHVSGSQNVALQIPSDAPTHFLPYYLMFEASYTYRGETIYRSSKGPLFEMPKMSHGTYPYKKNLFHWGCDSCKNTRSPLFNATLCAACRKGTQITSDVTGDLTFDYNFHIDEFSFHVRNFKLQRLIVQASAGMGAEAHVQADTVVGGNWQGTVPILQNYAIPDLSFSFNVGPVAINVGLFIDLDFKWYTTLHAESHVTWSGSLRLDHVSFSLQEGDSYENRFVHLDVPSPVSHSDPIKVTAKGDLSLGVSLLPKLKLVATNLLTSDIHSSLHLDAHNKFSYPAFSGRDKERMSDDALVHWGDCRQEHVLESNVVASVTDTGANYGVHVDFNTVFGPIKFDRDGQTHWGPWQLNVADGCL